MTVESVIGIFLSLFGLGMAVTIPFIAENSDEVCDRLIRFWIKLLPEDSREYWGETWIGECDELKLRGLNNGNPKNITRVFFAIDIGRIAISETLAFHGETISKRAFDIVLASTILLFVAPLLLTTALLVRLQDGAPALFKQKRRGRKGKYFDCYKLRTMVPDSHERLQELLAVDPTAREEWKNTQKLTHDPRITPLGHFIRRTSIDVLPQLVNVIRGDMSLVGPRPIQPSEEELYGEEISVYDEVRPGLTGLHEIQADRVKNLRERILLDKRYVLSRSFWYDVGLLLKSFIGMIQDDASSHTKEDRSDSINSDKKDRRKL